MTHRRSRRRQGWLVGMLAGLLGLGGCLSPVTMHRAVIEYDKTNSHLEAELLLLNIARSRHFHPIHFTTIASIAATFEFEANTGLSRAFVQSPGADTLSLTMNSRVAEKPTVTIVPIQGEEFTSRILTPFDESKLAFLFQQGVEPAILFRLMAREIDLFGYGESATLRNSPHLKKEYVEFRRRVLHLSSLNLAHSLYVGPIIYKDEVPVFIGREPATGDMMRGLDKILDALDKGHRWIAASDNDPFILTRKVVGRIVITNYDPNKLTNEERRSLNREAQGYPRNAVLVDIRPDKPGGDYPLHGVIILRGFNAIMRFLALGIAADPEFHVDKDKRTGEIPRSPPWTIAIEETKSRPTDEDAAFAVEYEGLWYSIRKARQEEGVIAPWNQEAFRVLSQLYQMTVTDVSKVPTPAITIAK